MTPAAPPQIKSRRRPSPRSFFSREATAADGVSEAAAVTSDIVSHLCRLSLKRRRKRKGVRPSVQLSIRYNNMLLSISVAYEDQKMCHVLTTA